MRTNHSFATTSCLPHATLAKSVASVFSVALFVAFLRYEQSTAIFGIQTFASAVQAAFLKSRNIPVHFA
jgi:hypothetical protein